MLNSATVQDKNTFVIPVATAVLLSGAVLMTSSNTANSQTITAPVLELASVSHALAESVQEATGVTRERSLQHAVSIEIRAEMAQEKEKEAAKLAREKEAAAKLAELRKAQKWQPAKVARPKQVSRGAQPQLGKSATENLLNYALSLKGVAYRYGGTDPRVGLDCSALILLAFHQIGVELPRTASQQFRMGVGIARSNLQPGDLVFFSTNGPGASHVGIYLGDGNFISTTTKGVRVEGLSSNYWNKYYRGARRVITQS